MPASRRFVYYVAMSADGFIARPDGAVDWLESRPAQDYGFDAFLQTVDTIVWGRTTFDGHGRSHGIAMFGPRRHIVLTRHPETAAPVEGVEFTDRAPVELARDLRTQPGRDVWVMGGAASASAMLDSGSLDELFVHVIPVLLRSGIPLLRPGGDVPLRLRESFAHPDGVLRLRYDVVRPAASPPG